MAKAKKKQYIYIIDDLIQGEQYVTLDSDEITSFGPYSFPTGMFAEAEEHGYSQRNFYGGNLIFTILTEGRHQVSYEK